MARFDKYDPVGGGFRAPLAADFTTPADLSVAFAVGLDVNGRVVKGAGQTGIVGVLILTKRKYAGDIVDVMTGGEVVEFPTVAAPGAAGTLYYGAVATGLISTTNTGVRLGHTVEGSRLVVRVTTRPAGA